MKEYWNTFYKEILSEIIFDSENDNLPVSAYFKNRCLEPILSSYSHFDNFLSEGKDYNRDMKKMYSSYSVGYLGAITNTKNQNIFPSICFKFYDVDSNLFEKGKAEGEKYIGTLGKALSILSVFLDKDYIIKENKKRNPLKFDRYLNKQVPEEIQKHISKKTLISRILSKNQLSSSERILFKNALNDFNNSLIEKVSSNSKLLFPKVYSSLKKTKK